MADEAAPQVVHERQLGDLRVTAYRSVFVPGEATQAALHALHSAPFSAALPAATRAPFPDVFNPLTHFEGCLNDEFVLVFAHVRARTAALLRQLESRIAYAELGAATLSRYPALCGQQTTRQGQLARDGILREAHALLVEASDRGLRKKACARPFKLGWDAAVTLTGWFAWNLGDGGLLPSRLPTAEEKEALLQSVGGGLTRGALDSFFINKRFRWKERMARWTRAMVDEGPTAACLQAFPPAVLSIESCWGGALAAPPALAPVELQLPLPSALPSLPPE